MAFTKEQVSEYRKSGFKKVSDDMFYGKAAKRVFVQVCEYWSGKIYVSVVTSEKYSEFSDYILLPVGFKKFQTAFQCAVRLKDIYQEAQIKSETLVKEFSKK